MDKREPTTEETAAERKPAQPGKKRFPLGTVLLALAAVLIVAALTTMEDGHHFAALRRWLAYGDSSATQDMYVYAADSNNRYGRLGDSLVVVNENVLQIISRDGEPVCDMSVRMDAPQLSVGKKQAAVCAVGEDALYVLDEDGVLRTMQTERGLCYYSARMNGSDYLAVTGQSTGYKAAVSVYNPSGDLIFHFDSYDNYLGDALVTEDCKYLAAVSLGSADGAFASELMIFDLTTAEQISSCVIRDGLVLELVSCGDRLLSLCDKRFTITTLAGETLLDRAYGNLYLHHYALTGDDFCALLLGRYQSGNICTLTTYDMDGAEVASLDLTEEVLDISAAGDYLAVLYGDSLVIYDRTLTEYARLDSTDYAGQVRMDEDGTALLISGSSAWRFLP